jgi:predicted transcriptional regulator
MQPATSVRLDPDIHEQLDNLAELLNRPKAWIIKEAVARYLKRETWYLAEVQKGIADMEEGRVITHECVAARLKAKGFHVGDSVD